MQTTMTVNHKFSTIVSSKAETELGLDVIEIKTAMGDIITLHISSEGYSIYEGENLETLITET